MNHVLKIKVTRPDGPWAETLRKLASGLPGVSRVDVNEIKGLARLVTSEPITMVALREKCAAHGLRIEEWAPAVLTHREPPGVRTPSNITKVQIDGMTCRSCEITIERQFKKIAGVKKVEVDATRGTARIVTEGGAPPKLEELQTVIGNTKYLIRDLTSSKREVAVAEVEKKRPSFWQIIGLFTLVLIIGAIVSRLGLLQPQTALGSSVSFAAAFLIGLVAASSSCVAVTGGLLLSTTARFRERYGNLSPLRRMQPVFLFVAGRVASYGILGGVIGAIGKALAPSPFVLGAITIAAALVMLVMGLDMLHLAPGWLKRLLPRMPKMLAHRVMDQEGKTHPATPLLLGAGTFFLPCGFTQALQLYGLATGSAFASGSVLFAFALGTTPALLALGLASSSLKGAFGRFFFRFSGALVVVLGFWNIQNGLAITGHPLSLPRFLLARAVEPVSTANAADPNVTLDGNTQVINLTLLANPPFYSPSNEFTVQSGKPVRMEISGYGTGCRSVFQIPQLGVQQFLDQAENVVEFTPAKPGKYTFSCSMGMFRGSLDVL